MELRSLWQKGQGRFQNRGRHTQALGGPVPPVFGNSYTGMHALHSFTYFLQLLSSSSGRIETIWPTEPKICTVWPLQGGDVCQPLF